MSFKELFANARKSDAYWVEKAIIEFTSDLHTEMKRRGKSNSDLAVSIGSSPAYITKVFKGQANFTIKSMVKLAHALNCRLHLKVAPTEYRVWWTNAPIKKDFAPGTPVVTTSDSYPGSDYVSKKVDQYVDGAIAA